MNKSATVNLYRVAEQADVILGPRKSFHIIITSTEPDYSADHEQKTTIYTLFSNLLLSALDMFNSWPSIASQVLLEILRNFW